MFLVAVSRGVYEVTSPSWLGWHVLLRKFYSVVAFTLVGFLFRRALEEHDSRKMRVTRVISGVAAYSAAIEVAQWLHGSREGLTWNTIDVVCGALGGALAVCDLALKRSSVLAPPRR